MRVSILLGLVCCLTSASPVRAERWRIANDVIEAAFELKQSGRFEFQSLQEIGKPGVWTGAQNRPVSLIRVTVGGQAFNQQTRYTLVGQSTQEINRGGRLQRIVLRDTEGRIEATLDLMVYPGQPVLRHRVSIRNLLPSPVQVTFADLLPYTFSDGGRTFETFRVSQWSIPADQNFNTTTQSLEPNSSGLMVRSGAWGVECSWFALADDTGRGLFAGWEFDGRVNATVQQQSSSRTVRIEAPIFRLNHPLGAGETFKVPGGFVGLFQGDWDEAGFQTQRFVEHALAVQPPDPATFPYVVWDSWGHQQNIDETKLRREADLAARLGFELFVVDLGWARKIGDWREDPAKFPSGLRALSDYVHSLGMKFGLHFALAEAMLDAPVLVENPDWTNTQFYNYFGAHSLCLSHKPAQEWVIREAIRLIDTYNVDWILQDGENMVKRCTKSTHTHDSRDSNYANSELGLNAVLSAVQQARPHVLWENCADGGTMMTFNMVQYYVTSITNDASGDFESRQAAWGATYPFPARYADRYMGEQFLSSYTTRSYMFGGPWNFMISLDALPPEQLEFAAEEIRAYKAMRAKIRGGKVFHLDPPAVNSFDAIQSYNATTRSGVAVVTRDGAAEDTYMLKPRGLAEDTNYRVTFEDDSRVLVMTGLQLMRDGVPVRLDVPRSAEIVYITQQ